PDRWWRPYVPKKPPTARPRLQPPPRRKRSRPEVPRHLREPPGLFPAAAKAPWRGPRRGKGIRATRVRPGGNPRAHGMDARPRDGRRPRGREAGRGWEARTRWPAEVSPERHPA